MTRIASPLIGAVALAVALAGCGSSGASAAQQATRYLRTQSVQGASGNPLYPASVHCDASSTPNCKVTYPNGEVDNCAVSISGNSSSASCTATQNAAPAPAPTPATQGDPISAKRWVGNWQSNYGPLGLRAHGGTVAGKYPDCSGKFEGVATGDQLQGTWSEGASTCTTSNSSADTSKGTFKFTLAAGGHSFAGTWAYADPNRRPTDDTWSGTK